MFQFHFVWYTIHLHIVCWLDIVILILSILIVLVWYPSWYCLLAFTPRHGNTGLVSSRASLTSWGEGASLALVGDPSSDGVKIKNLWYLRARNKPGNLWYWNFKWKQRRLFIRNLIYFNSSNLKIIKLFNSAIL